MSLQYLYVERDPLPDAMVALDGEKCVGLVSWRREFGDDTIVLAWVAQGYRRRGIATDLVRKARQRVPGLMHSYDRSDDAEAWSATTGLPREDRQVQDDTGGPTRDQQGINAARHIERMLRDGDWTGVTAVRHEAGPAGGRIPKGVKARPPFGSDVFKPRPVKINRMAGEDIGDLDPDEQAQVIACLKRLERGRETTIEAKRRPPLVGCFSLDVTSSLRVLVYLHTAGHWETFYVGHHDYDEAERRMRNVASKTASSKAYTWEYEVEWSSRKDPGLEIGTHTLTVEVDADTPSEAQVLAHSMVDSGLVTRRDPLPDGMVTRLTLLQVRPKGTPRISTKTAAELGPDGIWRAPKRGRLMWRGIQVNLPPDLEKEIRRLDQPPMEEHEIDQHLKIGPLVLDYLQNAYSDAWGKVGLGRHWTSNRHIADVSAMQGAPGKQWRIVLEALDEGQESDPDATGQGEFHRDSGAESEINLRPGTRVTVVGVYIEGLGYKRGQNFLGQPIRKVAVVRTAGRNGDLPEGMTITDSYRRDPGGNDAEGLWWVIARIGEEYVGSLSMDYDLDPTEVRDITVEPQYRRRGVATALLEYARRKYPSMVHSTALTDDGRAWRQKVAAVPVGVPVRNVRVYEDRGHDVTYLAKVDDGAPLVYRNIGKRRELEAAVEFNAWSAADGGFTVKSIEGDTQFTTSRAEALAWSHSLRQEDNGFWLLVTADISGQTVKFTAPKGEHTQRKPQYGQVNQFVDYGDGTGVFFPNHGLGIGVMGEMNPSRVVKKVETFVHEADGRIPIRRTFTWREFEAFASKRNNNWGRAASLRVQAEEEFKEEDHPRGQPGNPGQFRKKDSAPAAPKAKEPKAPKSRGQRPGALPAPPPGVKVKDLIKTQPDHPLVQAMKKRGDVYGSFLPPRPGTRYTEGDPRNDPEFEAVEKVKAALSSRYARVTREAIAKAIAKNKPEEEIERLRAAYRQGKKDRDMGIGGETQEIFDRRPDPKTGARKVYEPKRQALHDSLLEKLEATAADVPKDGKCIVLGGPPGAGKSTFLESHGKEALGIEFAEDGKTPTNYIVVNPDDFKEMLLDAAPLDPERYPGLEANELANIIHEESSDLAKRAVERLMSQGYNVILDITLSDAKKAQEKYLDLYDERYSYESVLVDGDMRNSLNNAGLRWKKPQSETGERTYSGRFLPMDFILSNSPTKEGYRSKNAQEFEVFAEDSRVDAALVYDPFTGTLKRVKERREVRAASLSVIRRGLSGMLRAEGRADVKTTEITERCMALKEGRISEEDLFQFLTEEVRYAEPEREYEHGEPGRREYIQDATEPMTPGSYEEVVRAYDRKLIPRALFERINSALYARGVAED